MANRTDIEWADSTFNPWIGCTKVGPGCDHCYAEVSTPSRTRGITWGAGAARQRTSPANWKLPERWNRELFFECFVCDWRGSESQLDESAYRCPGCVQGALRPARRRVFCASLSDWLDNEVSIEWFVEMLDLIRRTPKLDWLLLTKRIGTFQHRLRLAGYYALHNSRDVELRHWLAEWLAGRPPAHVWMGATVVNQAEADRDVSKLLQVPARVRFLSIEPMLGAIDLTRYFEQYPDHNGVRVVQNNVGPDWVIAGGESGHHARPMHPDWIRSLRDQCVAADVPLLFKQWGEFRPTSNCPEDCEREPTAVKLSGEVEPIPSEAFRHLSMQSINWAGMCRSGKKEAGNSLDGRQHMEWPL